MNFTSIKPDKSISLFVKDIWVFENKEKKNKTSLPFFADGYPGLMFQQTDNGLTVFPHNKKMPVVFLYGQTIKPIELRVDGRFIIIIFQLYPFVLRTFWNVMPESINDYCYYLDDSLEKNIDELNKELLQAKDISSKVGIMTALLLYYFNRKKTNLDFGIRKAIQSIIDAKGLISVQSIAEKENLTLRTFERRFLRETGLQPKQFAKIIQFQASLQQLTVKDYSKLTDIVYQNGFADQSHFIRVFKAFTGKTPKKFK